MPDLFMHFTNMGFDTSMYASSWFVTLFTTQLPLDVANRIMDVYLSEVCKFIVITFITFCLGHGSDIPLCTGHPSVGTNRITQTRYGRNVEILSTTNERTV